MKNEKYIILMFNVINNNTLALLLCYYIDFKII